MTGRRYVLPWVALTLAGWVGLWLLREPFGAPFWIALAAALGVPWLGLSRAAAAALTRDSALGKVAWLTVFAVSTAVLVGLLTFIVAPGRLFFQQVTPEGWKEDLRLVAVRLPKMHPAPFRHIDREAFVADLQELAAQAAEQSDTRTIAGLMRVVAGLRDGHSMVLPWMQLTRFHVLPLRLRYFADGLFVTEAGAGYRDLVGARLVAVAGVEEEQARERLAALVPADNAMNLRDRLPLFFGVPELLQAAGVTETSGTVELTLRDVEGAVLRTPVAPVSSTRYAYWRWRTDETPDAPFEGRLLEGSRTYLVDFRRVQDAPEETIGEFGRRTLREAREAGAERFVIDLRRNGGGDNTLSGGFLDALASDTHFNRRGRLFALIGPGTFSAAVHFVTGLELRTRALFVGLPTGGRPNHFGDPEILGLPHSMIRIRVSSLYWQNSVAGDDRPTHEPDLRVEPTYADWAAGRDPALEAAVTYRAPERELAPWPEERLARLSGVYRFDFDAPMIVTAGTDGGLRAEVAGFLETGLYPRSDGTLATDIAGATVEPVVADARSDDALMLSIHGTRRRLPRLPDDHLSWAARLFAGDLKPTLDAYRRQFATRPGHPAVRELRLNALGYALLEADRPEAAREVFRLNVDFYPGSFNAYDSLGEACMVLGDREEAIRNYERSLRLNPDNGNARRKLKQLER